MIDIDDNEDDIIYVNEEKQFIDSIINKKNNQKTNIVLNATSGMDVNDNYYINDNHTINDNHIINDISLIENELKLIDNLQSSELDSSSEKDISSSSNELYINNLHCNLHTNLHSNLHSNNWNDESENIVNDWYRMLKQQSFIYQKILDYNIYISNIILIFIVILSSFLGFLSTFKIYFKTAEFEFTSDIILIISHTIIVILISISKIYNDETTNEKYRNHISELDELKAELSSQLLLSREDRQNKTEFFIKYSTYYNRLITKSPNLSIKEINYAKSIYLEYVNHNL